MSYFRAIRMALSMLNTLSTREAQALQSFIDGTSTVREAALKAHIPKSTLHDRIKSRRRSRPPPPKHSDGSRT